VRRHGPRISNLTAGIIVIFVVLVAVYFGFTKALPFQHHFTLHAAFRTSNNIVKNSPVRVAGVNVGKVTGFHHIAGGQGAIVDMTINNTGLPIHDDATLVIRPRIFLEGNYFVDLHPGSPSAPTIKDGAMIPVQNTSTPVQLDQILAALPSSTRSDLQTLLKELTTGLSGRGGAGFNLSIPYWGPAYEDSAIVNNASLGTAEHDLSNYIASSGAVAQALDADPPALRSLVTTFNQTATALSDQNRALSQAIADLPQTLRVGIPALRALDAAFPSLRKLVNALRPATRSSVPVLDAGIPFARQAQILVSKPYLRGLVDALKPAVPALTQLNIGSVPLLSQTRYASQCQNSVIIPWSQTTLQDSTLPAEGPVYQEFEKGLVGVGADGRAGDANGLWNRVLATAGNFAFPSGPSQFTLSNLPITGGNPVKPAGKLAFEPNVPCETQETPNLASTPGAPPPGEQDTAAPTTAAGKALYAHGTTALVAYARKLLKLEHLTNVLSVTSTPLSSSLIPHLKQLGTFLGGGK
jgi:virulence factor Mce-like protein